MCPILVQSSYIQLISLSSHKKKKTFIFPTSIARVGDESVNIPAPWSLWGSIKTSIICVHLLSGLLIPDDENIEYGLLIWIMKTY